MSRFQRDLRAAEKQLDLLDRAVILTYEASLWGEQSLQGRWPDDRALREPATLEQMIYLCRDRLEAARRREAIPCQNLFANILEALDRMQNDLPGSDEFEPPA